MPRIRSLKPEVARDAKLAKVSRESRYTFLLLLTQADDAGYFIATPRTLLGALYPHDPDVTERTLTKELDSLLALGLLRCFDSEDGVIGQIAKFTNHQKIDHPSTSHLARASRTPRESFAKGVLSLDLGPTSPVPPAAKPPTRGPASLEQPTAPPPGDPFEQAWKQYPKRLGGNPKAPALKAWNARISEGEAPATLLAGTLGYRRDVLARGKDSTEFVLMARTFYGPDRRYRDFLPPEPKPAKPTPPPPPEPTPEEAAQAAADAELALVEIRRLKDDSRRAAQPNIPRRRTANEPAVSVGDLIAGAIPVPERKTA